MSGFVVPAAAGWQPGRVRGGGGTECAAAALIVARPKSDLYAVAKAVPGCADIAFEEPVANQVIGDGEVARILADDVDLS